MSSRENVRLEHHMPIKIKTIFDASGNNININYEIDAKIINISTSGILIETDHSFETGMSFYCTIDIDDEEIILLPMVLRMTTDINTNMLLYGCKFTHLSVAEDYLIRRFIFRKQLEQRKDEIKSGKRPRNYLLR